jgi:uncharacterized protein YwgA
MHPIVPLLQLIKTLREIEGRKRLQKMIHILQELGVGFPERFQYSAFGMYSLQLKSEVELLKQEGLIEECTVNASLAIRGTSAFKRLVKDFQISDPPWADKARYLNKLSPAVLEGISTILYLWHTETDEQVVQERLLTLKPHLSDDLGKCFSEAKKLKPPPARPAATELLPLA